MSKSKRGKTPPRHIPGISIHPNNISFNALLAKTAGLETGMWVKMEVLDKDRKIVFEFSNKDCWPGMGSYTLGANGGAGKESGGKAIEAKAKINEHDWLWAVARQPRHHRWFQAKTAGRNRWAIEVMPCFESIWKLDDPYPVGTGIYRCFDGETVVGIGLGHIANRIKAHRRDGWIFQRVEYSLIGDSKKEAECERFWHDRHVEDHGQLPKYNKISGRSKKDSGEEVA